MQRNNVKIFLGCIGCSLVLIVCYQLLIRQDSSDAKTVIKEVVVYKKEDILELLKITNIKINDTAKPKLLKHDYQQKHPNFMSCRQTDLKKWSSKNAKSTNINYANPAANETHNKRFIRGILVYFPFESSEHFKLEFKWFYRSWIEMLNYEPAKWRTDLIVFIENDANYFKDNSSFLSELNCSFSHIRTSDLDKPMCTLVNYVALSKRKLSKLSDSVFEDGDNSKKKLKYEYLLNNVDIYSDEPGNLLPFYTVLKKGLSNYGYLDSILMAFDGYKYFKSAGYDYLIRSDMDVFLTPLFGTWLPDNCNDFYVGRGGYSDDFNRNRLSRIAKDLELEHAGISNLGKNSTFKQNKLVKNIF